MSFFGRAASFATILACATSLVCGCAPGLAKGLDRTSLAASLSAGGRIVKSTTALLVPPVEAADPQIAVDAEALPEYASLNAAVDAQSAAAEIGRDLECLAGAVYFESHGEPLAGQLAVAEVILNRAGSGRFPPSVCDVVTQPGQFSFVRGGHVPAIASSRAYSVALAVARVALARQWSSPAPQALFFHARRASPGWGKVQVAAIGNHVFYR